MDRAPNKYWTVSPGGSTLQTDDNKLLDRCHEHSHEDRHHRCQAPAVRSRAGDGRPTRAPGPEPVRCACAEGEGADRKADEPIGRCRSSMPDAGVVAGCRGCSIRGDQRQGRGGRRPGRDTTRDARGLGPGRRPGHERPRSAERVARCGQPAASTSIRHSPAPTRAETASPTLRLRVSSVWPGASSLADAQHLRSRRL
jgi:hypothetical protein